jgi:hypothetical protein
MTRPQKRADFRIVDLKYPWIQRRLLHTFMYDGQLALRIQFDETHSYKIEICQGMGATKLCISNQTLASKFISGLHNTTIHPIWLPAPQAKKTAAAVLHAVFGDGWYRHTSIPCSINRGRLEILENIGFNGNNCDRVKPELYADYRKEDNNETDYYQGWELFP